MSIEIHHAFKNLHIVRHPLIAHKLSILRDARTTKKTFKELIDEITLFLAYEATKDLPLTMQRITTPLEACDLPMLAGKKPVILPILRAGLGMVDGFLTLMPSARVGHIGLYRNEDTLEPQEYYFEIPLSSQGKKGRHFFVCDPMLATGGSMVAALDRLKAEKVEHITVVCIVAVPEGARRCYQSHPDVPIFAASLDRELNIQGYILPGLGDAGDRLFGTR